MSAQPGPSNSRATRLYISALLIIGTIPFTGIAGCQSPPSATELEPADRLAHLASCMTGTFSSASQAEANPEHYQDIRLVMAPVWSDREDGPWLYVEQAAADGLERPYRQRIYHLVVLDDGTFRSDVYTLPGNPLRFTACWRRDAPLAKLTPNDLERREGCSIVLEPAGSETYIGSTIGEGCASSIRGASYATSEVRITPNVLESWDRGFNAEGEQVWGATDGPYRFDKIANGPPR